MKGPAEAAAATGRGGRSGASRPGPTRRRLTSQWARGWRGAGAAKRPIGENEARAPALRSPVRPSPSRSFTFAFAALPPPSRTRPHSSEPGENSASPRPVRHPPPWPFSQGKCTIGLAAAFARCRKANLSTVAILTCVAQSSALGPWRPCGPEAKRFACISAVLSPAALVGWPVNAGRSAGMLRPAG